MHAVCVYNGSLRAGVSCLEIDLGYECLWQHSLPQQACNPGRWININVCQSTASVQESRHAIDCMFRASAGMQLIMSTQLAKRAVRTCDGVLYCVCRVKCRRAFWGCADSRPPARLL